MCGISCGDLLLAILQSPMPCTLPLSHICLAHIFQWDAEDLQQLHAAKQSELHAKGTWSMQKKDVLLHTTRKELALHCRRQTRGTAETARLIKELIDVFSSDKGKDAILILC